MPMVIQPEFTHLAGLRVAVVVSQFNAFLTSSLEGAAVETLRRHGVPDELITVVRVPGAFELPLTLKALAQTGRYDGLVAIGCVIRGATSHYDLVCNEAAKGVAAVSQAFDLPIGFGLVTTETIEQAIERAGTKAGNKGVDAAMAMLEMASLLRQIKA